MPSYLRPLFAPLRPQKLPVDVGATCPVRDGRIAHGGCAFCNGRSFVPAIANPAHSITQQLEDGKRFFQRKQPRTGATAYLAYFQAGSNTYLPLEHLQTAVNEALAVDGIRGIILATRPDTLSAPVLQYLTALKARTFVMLELGVESLTDEALQRCGRGHTAAQAIDAIRRVKACGLPLCVHLILGLPGDTEATMLRAADVLSTLPVDAVKLHQLQILRHSRFEAAYAARPEQFQLFTAESYAQLLSRFLPRLRRDICVERLVAQAPPAQLIEPRLGVSNEALRKMVEEKMQKKFV